MQFRLRLWRWGSFCFEVKLLGRRGWSNLVWGPPPSLLVFIRWRSTSFFVVQWRWEKLAWPSGLKCPFFWGSIKTYKMSYETVMLSNFSNDPDCGCTDVPMFWVFLSPPQAQTSDGKDQVSRACMGKKRNQSCKFYLLLIFSFAQSDAWLTLCLSFKLKQRLRCVSCFIKRQRLSQELLYSCFCCLAGSANKDCVNSKVKTLWAMKGK